MNKYMLLLFIATFFTAFSQLLLKISANEKHENSLREYLNAKVITAYFIFAVVLLMNTYAFTRVDMKYGAVIDAFTYVFVLILSRLVLKEKFSKWKLFGNAVIVAGVIVYTLQPFG